MKIGFIGCGNMGGALARSVARVSYASILVYDKDTDKAKALADEIAATATELEEVVKCDYIFLGVKPNLVGEVLGGIKDIVGGDAVIVSMAAGVAIGKITDALDRDIDVIRIMPNTPVAYGEGMILYTVSEGISEYKVERFLDIMKFAGELDRIPESLIDAGSAVSGCGPAFVFMFIEALADGGVAAGLPREKAMQYAAQTVLGAAKTVMLSGKHPAVLKDAVCSPGGSTIEGVLALEEGGMRNAVSDAIRRSFEKTKKLGK